MDYVMFADEANPEQSDPTKFFIFGAAWVPSSKIPEAHEKTEDLLKSYGVPPGEKIKFNRSSKPDCLTHDEHRAIKQRIMEIAAECETKFCGYAILHAISHEKDGATLAQWGADALVAKFNEFLSEKSATGWVQFDRMDGGDPFAYLRRKFSSRVATDEGNVRLDRILGYSFTCDRASHISSITDVLVGGFRFIINEPDKDIAGKAIFRLLRPIMWSRLEGTRIVYREYGLLLRPKTVKVPSYAADYEEVRDRLKGWALN